MSGHVKRALAKEEFWKSPREARGKIFNFPLPHVFDNDITPAGISAEITLNELNGEARIKKMEEEQSLQQTISPNNNAPKETEGAKNEDGNTKFCSKKEGRHGFLEEDQSYLRSSEIINQIQQFKRLLVKKIVDLSVKATDSQFARIFILKDYLTAPVKPLFAIKEKRLNGEPPTGCS